MTTSNKNFKVKNGLEVQGTSATVDGNDILTKAAADINYLNSVVGEIYSYGEEPPVSPNIGDRWVDSTTGYEYTWLDDGTSTQWVETRGSGYVGPANELTVGTVTTGAVGTNVSVDITGESPSQTINFTIPRGDKGDQGDQGIQGIQGEQGIQGIQGNQGIQGLKGDTGEGVPAGGSGGYVLSKASADDFDTQWIAAASGGGGSIITSDTAPVFPNDGDVWYDTTDGKSYVFVDDIDSGQWVGFSTDPVGPAGIGIPAGGSQSQILAKITGGDYATEWIDLPPSELALQTDVDLTTPVGDGQVLAYNNATSVWENKTLDISATEVSDTAPTGATEGDAWFDSSLGTLYIYTSGVWVEVKANSALDATLPTRVNAAETNLTFLTTRVNSIEPTVATMTTSKANLAGPNSYSGSQIFVPANSAGVPVITRAVNAQTADLQQWQDSTGSTIAKIDASGRLSLSTQPVFQATNNGGTANNGTVLYSSVPVNIGSCYNASTGRFTAPVSGRYLFCWSQIGTTSATVHRYSILKNGVYTGSEPQLRLDSTATGSEYAFGSKTWIYNLAANDYVTIKFMSDNSEVSFVDGGDYSGFSGQLIG